MQQLIKNFYSLDIKQQKQLINILTGSNKEPFQPAQQVEEETSRPAKQKNSSKIDQPRGQVEVITVESSLSNSQSYPPQLLQPSNNNK